MLLALFGIDDGSLNLAVNLLILTLIVVWIALIWWTWSDARLRISDPVLVTTATAASLFPFIGTAVYTILRPPEFLADAHERELETRAAELRLRRLTETSCPRCEHPVELSWLRCPECRHRLKDPCRSCGRPVDPRWAICPHCEVAVSGPTQRKEPAKGSRPPARQRAERPQGEGQRQAEGPRQAEAAPRTQRRAPSAPAAAAREPSQARRQPDAGEERPPQRQTDGGKQRPSRRRPKARTWRSS